MKLDKLDAKILNVLQDDPRQSAGSIGDIVGLSQSAVSRRIQTLTKAEVIEGHCVVVSPRKVGYPIRVSLLCSLQGETPEGQDRLLAKLPADPLVTRVARVSTGEADLSFTVIARDLPGYDGHVVSYQQDFPALRILRRDLLGDELKPRLSIPVAGHAD